MRAHHARGQEGSLFAKCSRMKAGALLICLSALIPFLVEGGGKKRKRLAKDGSAEAAAKPNPALRSLEEDAEDEEAWRNATDPLPSIIPYLGYVEPNPDESIGEWLARIRRMPGVMRVGEPNVDGHSASSSEDQVMPISDPDDELDRLIEEEVDRRLQQLEGGPEAIDHSTCYRSRHGWMLRSGDDTCDVCERREEEDEARMIEEDQEQMQAAEEAERNEDLMNQANFPHCAFTTDPEGADAPWYEGLNAEERAKMTQGLIAGRCLNLRLQERQSTYGQSCRFAHVTRGRVHVPENSGPTSSSSGSSSSSSGSAEGSGGAASSSATSSSSPSAPSQEDNRNQNKVSKDEVERVRRLPSSVDGYPVFRGTGGPERPRSAPPQTPPRALQGIIRESPPTGRASSASSDDSALPLIGSSSESEAGPTAGAQQVSSYATTRRRRSCREAEATSDEEEAEESLAITMGEDGRPTRLWGAEAEAAILRQLGVMKKEDDRKDKEMNDYVDKHQKDWKDQDKDGAGSGEPLC